MLKTEMRNEASMHIDEMDTLTMLRVMQEENRNATEAVGRAVEEIATACDQIAARMQRGGRLFYIGAGTSGRLGVIDAAECPPTFGVSADEVIGIIAGGEKCMVRAAEAEEDNPEAGEADLAAYRLTEKDSVIGISASGGAAYVVGALSYAERVGAYTVSLSSNRDTPIEHAAHHAIVIDTGAEVITGSTRMKSGTAQKLVLNMISTSVMIKTGKVYENMMINLRPTNRKLRGRMIRIVGEITGVSPEASEKLLCENDFSIRKAINAFKDFEKA